MSKRGDVALEVIPGAPQGRVPDELIPPPDPGEDEPSLREYLDVLVGGRRLIAAVVVAAAVLGGAYALLATPIYRSDVLVQVEDQKAGTGLLGDLTAAFGDSTPAEAEIEILRSRAIVGDAVDELKLDLVARPSRFPVLGGFLARHHDPVEGVAGAFLGLSSFGWGGERIKIDRLDVPEQALRRAAHARRGRGRPVRAPRSGRRDAPRGRGGQGRRRERRRRVRRRAGRAARHRVRDRPAPPRPGHRGSPGGPPHLGEGQEDGHPAARARGRRSASGRPRSSTRSRAPTFAGTSSGRAPRRGRRSSSSRSSSPSCAATSTPPRRSTRPTARRRAAWT